jgi:hypothetical protein
VQVRGGERQVAFLACRLRRLGGPGRRRRPAGPKRREGEGARFGVFVFFKKNLFQTLQISLK